MTPKLRGEVRAMAYTEILIRLLAGFEPAERAALERGAHVPGRRVRARLGGAADRFWRRAAELGWAEAGEIELIGGRRTRPYRLTALGARAVPVLLERAGGARRGRRAAPDHARA
jgi:hypothetical protein